VTGDPRYREYYEHILAIRNGHEPRPENYGLTFWDRITFEHEFQPRREGEPVSLLTLFRRSHVRPEEIALLREAKRYADALTKMEREAFRLMDLATIRDSLSDVNRLAAQQLLHGAQYHRLKAAMMERLDAFFQAVDRRTSARVERIARRSAIIDREVLILVLMILTVALYGWHHARRRIVTPLRELIRWTDRLREGRFRPRELRATGRDEIGQLARSFNAMAETLQRSLEDLNVKAHTDRLTGLANRALLEIEMERMQLAVRYYDVSGFLVLFDLDHFKAINDRYGHDVGDRVLVRFAQLLREKVDRPHIPGRWGGEEFLILVKNVEEEAVRELAESLRESVARLTFPEGIPLTVSAGIAPLSPHSEPHETLRHADEALYRAKSLGRNRVVIWKEAQE
jgi:diguanylate cyclase (GGDEF)-like protein